MNTIFVKSFILSALLMFSIAASAQVYIGGSVGGSYGKDPSASTKSWSASINPEAGYLLNDNWAFGARISYGKSESKVESPYLNKTDTKVSLLTVNPYAAYSAIRFGGFAVWAEAGLQLVPKQNGIAYTKYAAYVSPVLTYDLSRHFLLKTNLNFAGLTLSGNSNGGFAFSGSFGGDDALSFGDDLSIGFVYRF